jgi:hypothetical protein
MTTVDAGQQFIRFKNTNFNKQKVCADNDA